MTNDNYQLENEKSKNLKIFPSLLSLQFRKPSEKINGKFLAIHWVILPNELNQDH